MSVFTVPAVQEVLPTGARNVVVDTETNGAHFDEGGYVSSVGVGWWEDDGTRTIHTFTFDQGPGSHKEGGSQPKLFDVDHLECNRPPWEFAELVEWLSHQWLIMHNAKFDLAMLRAGSRGEYNGAAWETRGVDLTERLVWDTMLGQRVAEPLEQMGLKPTAARLWGETNDEQRALKPWLPRGMAYRYDLVPWDVMEPYLWKDIELTMRLYERQEAFSREGGLNGELLLREVDLCKVLTGMERRGVGVNTAEALEAKGQLDDLMADLKAAMPFDVTPAKAKAWFFGEQNMLPHCGPDNLRKCCVRELIAQGSTVAEQYELHEKLKTLRGRYYVAMTELPGEDGRLRTDFRQTGTVTGRLSSSRVNLQAIPHDGRFEGIDLPPPRQLFTAKPGHVLVEMDLSQAELRVAAKLSGCKVLLDAYREGADVHQLTADNLGVSRPLGKRANFALLYQIGVSTFIGDLDKTVGIKLARHEGEAVVNGWRELYPEIPEANRKAEAAMIQRGFVKILASGGRRFFGPTEHTYKAFNAVVQGNIAEQVKTMMITIDQRWPESLLLQIHDSVIVELPEDSWEETAEEMRILWETMASLTFDISMPVDMKRWV